MWADPAGCRGNEKGCSWERKAVMAAGLEEACRFFLSVFTPRCGAVSYKKKNGEWERRKIQLNEILKAVHGEEKRYCIS